MSIDAISNDSFEQPLGNLEIESNKEFESLLDSQDHTTMGVSPLVAQEQLRIGATPNLRSVRLKETCGRLERLILRIEDDSIQQKAYLHLIEKVASQDPTLAQNYVEKLETDRDQLEAFLVLSKVLPSHEAQMVLEKAKGLFPISPNNVDEVLMIYREEKRLGLPSAEDTIQALHQAIEQELSNLWWGTDLALLTGLVKVELELESKQLIQTLQIALGEIRSDPAPLGMDAMLYGRIILDFGECAGKANLPITGDFVQLFKQQLSRVESGDTEFNRFFDIPEGALLFAWEKILSFEESHPVLSDRFTKDFEIFIEIVRHAKSQNAHQTDTYDFWLLKVSQQLSVENPEFAQRLIRDMDGCYYQWCAMVDMFKSQANHKGFDTYREFKKLEQMKWGDSEVSFRTLKGPELCFLAAKFLDSEKAIAFLETVKEEFVLLPKDAKQLRQFNLEMLPVGTQLRLSSRKETLKAINVETLPSSKIQEHINDIIDAELSLL